MKMKLSEVLEQLKKTQAYWQNSHKEKNDAGDLVPVDTSLWVSDNKLDLSGKWFRQSRAANAKTLAATALEYLERYPSGENYDVAVFNHNFLIRLASHLAKLDPKAGSNQEIELTEMDVFYLKPPDEFARVSKLDLSHLQKKPRVFMPTQASLYEVLVQSREEKEKAQKQKKEKKGKKKGRKGRKDTSASAPSEEVEGLAEEGETEAPAPEAKSWLPSIGGSGFSLKKVGMIGLLLVALYLILGTGLLGTISGMFSGDGAGSMNQPAYVQPELTNPGYVVNPDGTVTVIPDQNPGAQLTGSTQNALNMLNNVKVVFAAPGFWGLIFAIFILGGMLLALDRSFDLELDDFGKFLIIMATFFILVILPFEKWFGMVMPVTMWGDILVMNPKMAADAMWLPLVLIGCGVLAWKGNEDFTVMAIGFLWAGGIIFLVNTAAFLTWRPPLLAILCWLIAFAFHLFEMVRQEDTGRAFGVSAIGFVIEVVAFFFLIGEFSTSSTPFIAANAQILAYLVAVAGVTFVMIVLMFGTIKTTVFQGAGRLQTIIETAMFDALILTVCFGGLLLVLILWWS